MVRATACRSILIAICILLGLTVLASAQSGERKQRYAIVIGNSAYTEGPLATPVNDAMDIGTALAKMDWDVSRCRMRISRACARLFETFRTDLRPGMVGLFYFAGHGLQVNGENYLVPIGARIAREQDVKSETVPVRWILDTMKDAANDINVIILDASRVLPLPAASGRFRGDLP